ncbi:hypothetical protein GQ53DRAFT_740644 [Thozetella sp. PMI_491]|nr:hypothetical protein GQ53DRAFT_740644 [Thozetella sp. PMI_491]
MSSIYLRPAEESEVRTVTQLRMDAFGYGGTAEVLFPDPATRVADFSAWRFMSAADTFADPGRHIIVAVERQEDGTEEIAGSAEWIAPGGPTPGLSEEELEARKAESKKKQPASFNPEGMANFMATTGEAIAKALANAGLPEDAHKQMWDLNSLAVSSIHQRKGIGKILVQWGLDRAAQEGKHVLILANPTGTHLYRKMGLEEVGDLVIFAGEPQERHDAIFIQRYKE